MKTSIRLLKGSLIENHVETKKVCQKMNTIKSISTKVENKEPKVDPEIEKEIMEEILKEIIKDYSTKVPVGKEGEDIVEITVRTEVKEDKIEAKVTGEVEEKAERGTEEKAESMQLQKNDK